jgi:hypothetical protein
MTVLEVGGRTWRAAPACQTSQVGERSRDALLVRRPRIYLIAAFLVADLAIFWFGLSMSGLTLSGSAGNGPRSLPATASGAVVRGSGGSSADPATDSLRSLSGAVVEVNPGTPSVAGPAAQAAQPSAGSAAAAPSAPTASKPVPGHGPATNPPLSPPKAPAPGLPGLLPAVDQAANRAVTGLIDILAPVVQTTQTTVTKLLPPIKLPSLIGPR